MSQGLMEKILELVKKEISESGFKFRWILR